MIDFLEIVFDKECNCFIYIDNNFIGNFLNNIVQIEIPAKTGIRELKIKLANAEPVEIKDVKINHTSLRHLIYLSWTEDSTKKWQPCTALWEIEQVWKLPFGTPVSWWLDHVLSNIHQSLIGQDLSKHYDIWYPDRIDLPDYFPPIVRDFFSKDYSFTAIAKKENSFLHFPINQLVLDQSLLSVIKTRAFDLWENNFFNTVKKEYPQDKYNYLDDSNWKPNQMQGVRVMTWDSSTKQITSTFDIKKYFPELFDFLLQFQDIHHVHLNFLNPKSYLAPHRDLDDSNLTDSHLPVGCSQYYIPLEWNEGCYLKLAGAGIIGNGGIPWVINNSEYTHCVVNTSDKIRLVLTIRANAMTNKKLIKQCG